jgi:UDP-glucose 4-epimerase
MRDFVFVDDVCDAFLRAGATDALNGQALNVGGSEPISHRDLVTLLLEVAGGGECAFVPWPPDKKAIDIGSFYADSKRFRQMTGWTPAVSLREGLVRTIAFYREHLSKYVDEGRAAVVPLA